MKDLFFQEELSSGECIFYEIISEPVAKVHSFQVGGVYSELFVIARQLKTKRIQEYLVKNINL